MEWIAICNLKIKIFKITLELIIKIIKINYPFQMRKIKIEMIGHLCIMQLKTVV
jgi:hypothetical protein